MKKALGKDIIDKYLKKDIDDNIRSVAIDLINFLSRKGYNVIKYIKRINNTRFFFFDSQKECDKKFEYEIDSKKIQKEIKWDEYEGLYVPVIDLNSKGQITFVEHVCGFNLDSAIKLDNKMYKQKIIHELLHLFSAYGNVKKEGEIYIFYNGVNQIVFKIENNKLKRKNEFGLEEINEAITEHLANEIYKSLYDKNFFTAYEDFEGFRYPYINQYYLMTGFMRIINLFTNLSTRIDKLLFSYLTNNLDYYLKDVENVLALNKDTFKELFYDLNIMIDSYIYSEKESFEKDFKKFICPLMKALCHNLYVYIKISDMKEEKKKECVQKIEEYVKYLFSYPIFNLIQDDMNNYLKNVYDL